MRSSWIPIAALAVLAVSPAAGAAVADTLEQCEALVRERPGSFDGYECMSGVPRKNKQWDVSRRRLEAYLAVDPENHLARFALAALESAQGRDRAEPLFLEAAEGLAAQNRRPEEVRARINLAVFYFIRGRHDDGEAQLEQAAVVANDVGDRLLLARVRNIQGRAASQRNELGRAWLLFKEVEDQIVPDGPQSMQAFCLSMLGVLSEKMGRLERSMEYQQRAAEIQHEIGDLWAEARARSNLSMMAAWRWGEGKLAHEDALAVAHRSLEATVAAGTVDGEGRVRIHLGSLLRGGEAGAEFRRGLELCEQVRDAIGTDMARRALALNLLEAGEPEEAMAQVEAALAPARRAGDRDGIARGLLVRAELHRAQGEAALATADLLEAIETIESSRDLQKDELTQSRFFAQWITAYQRLVGQHLESAEAAPSPETLEAAFRTMERMRARALLDSLDAARATTALAPTGPLQERRNAVLDSISGIQRKLMDPELPDDERDGTLAELERLELEEQALRQDLAREDPRFAELRRPVFPGTDEVRGALGPDEALLSYQLAPWKNTNAVLANGAWGGGSWLIVLTRETTRVHRLPGRLALQDAVEELPDLIRRRDGSESARSGELYEALLAEALDALPSSVRHLIVVPDGALHHVPFAALRPSAADDPLGVRYRVSRAPSAATWLKWRTTASAGHRSGALVLADPELVVGGAEAASEIREWSRNGATLGPLPHARDEARFVARSLGGETLLLTGKQASESFIKGEDLTRYGVVHLAAHALLDDEYPPRSAILLSPGVESEDGLLQLREVVGLNLAGRPVVLSACRSASGTLLSGEGVMGLARAFFQAGSPAVVGSLWAVRDREAADFFRLFYRHLSRGVSVSEALTLARRDRFRAGAPAVAWAGMVVLGDGALVPFPGGSATWWERWRAAIVLAAIASLVAIVLAVARRRTSEWHR